MIINYCTSFLVHGLTSLTTPLYCHFRNVKARAYIPTVIGKAANIQLELHTDINVDELKSGNLLSFGQLPLLVDGDVTLCQTGAIARYLARKGGIEGDTPMEYALSEMLIEESQDLFGILLTANFATDKINAYSKLFTADGEISVHLKYLESLHPGTTNVFYFPKPLAGSYAIAAILDMIFALEPTSLEAFPNVKLFYESMIKLPAFDEVKDFDMLLKRFVTVGAIDGTKAEGVGAEKEESNRLAEEAAANAKLLEEDRAAEEASAKVLTDYAF